jgi:hypothetical protein
MGRKFLDGINGIDDCKRQKVFGQGEHEGHDGRQRI